MCSVRLIPAFRNYIITILNTNPNKQEKIQMLTRLEDRFYIHVSEIKCKNLKSDHRVNHLKVSLHQGAKPVI